MTSSQWLLVCCLLSVFTPTLGLSKNKRLKALVKKHDNLRAEYNNTRKEVKDLKANQEQLQNDVSQLNSAVWQLQSDVRALQASQCDCEALEAEIKNLKDRDDELEDLIKQLLADDCANSPCKNGGTCKDGLHAFICHCPPGYTGVHCEHDVNECSSFPCQNDGTCVDGINGFRCQCPPGYYGVLCMTVDGRWGPWSAYSPCSVTCGSGFWTRTRTCVPPQHGGKPCTGPDRESAQCAEKNCPVDGSWGPWSAYGPCSVMCGSGTKTRTRKCTPPQYGGKPCVGSSQQVDQCFDKPCPVDGSWGPWSAYGPCSVTCGSGTKTRTRKCTPPQHGGKNCVGSSQQMDQCFHKSCPVDGTWGSWGGWSSCSTTCGTSTRTRKRVCIAPQHGGKPCPGQGYEVAHCLVPLCPVDGGWSLWGRWGLCLGRCFEGTRTRTRRCTNPTSSNGGKLCSGSGADYVPCRLLHSKLQPDCIDFPVESQVKPK